MAASRTSQRPSQWVEKFSPAAVARLAGLYEPTPEQVEITRYQDGPLLVVAGAGSGKTATMALRAVYAVANQIVTPDQILGLTFTRKAAGELGKRINAAVATATANMGERDGIERGHQLVDCSTYNSFAAGIVRDYGVLAGVNPDATLIQDAARATILKDIIRAQNPKIVKDVGLDSVIDYCAKLAGDIVDHLLDPATVKVDLEEMLAAATVYLAGPKGKLTSQAQEILTLMADKIILVDVVSAYLDYKRANNLVDFADQVAIAAQLVELEHVQNAYRRRYRMVMLDEFQDTSVAQLKFLSPLFRSTPSDPFNVIAVGDPMQAIYGFRGGSEAALTQFRTEFGASETDANLKQLTRSYRNPPQVLAVANEIAKEAAQWRTGEGINPAQLTSPEGVTHDTAPAVFWAEAEDARHQYEIVADWLAKNWGPQRHERSAAVLCRARTDFAQIVAILEEYGLAVETYGSRDLLDAPLIMDLRAVLRVVANPDDGVALMRLIDRLDIGARDLDQLWRHSGGEEESQLAEVAVREHCQPDWIEYLPPLGGHTGQGEGSEGQEAGQEAGQGEGQPGAQAPSRPDRTLRGALTNLAQAEAADGGVSAAGRSRLARLHRQLTQVEACRDRDLAELVREIIRVFQLDLDLYLSADPARNRELLPRFMEYIGEFKATAQRGDVVEFVTWLDLVEKYERGVEAPPTVSSPGVVQLMTMHAAKGLEWDYVACPAINNLAVCSVNKTARGWINLGEGLPYDLRQDSESLPRWFGADPDLDGKTSFTKLMEGFNDDMKAYTYRTGMQLMYVAFTRSRQALLAVGTDTGAGDPKSRARIMVGDVELLPPLRVLNSVEGVVHYQTPQIDARYDEDATPGDETTGGEPCWPTVPSPTRAALRKVAEAVAAARPRGADLAAQPDSPAWQLARGLLARHQASGTVIDLEVPSQLPATQMAKLLLDRDAFARGLFVPQPKLPAQGAVFGQAVHDWAQHYFKTGQTPQVAYLQAGQGAVPDADVVVEARFAKLFKKAIATITDLDLESQFEVEEVEFDVVAATQPRLVGRIDLLVRERETGKLWIIDWKTGEYQPDHSHQIDLYRQALAQDRGIDVAEIGTRLVYVTKGECVDDPEGKSQPLPARLQAVFAEA